MISDIISTLAVLMTIIQWRWQAMNARFDVVAAQMRI
jgi:hypothetical protein